MMLRLLLAAAVLLAGQSAPAANNEIGFDVDRLKAAIEAYGLSGDVLVASDGAAPARFGHYGLLPERPANDDHGVNWRLASVTKQIVAVLAMQEVAVGRIALDRPMSAYLPRFRSPHADRVTVRQLLQHRSGLPNPDDTPAASGQMPAFYRPDYRGSRDPLTGYCAGPPKGEPGGAWTYNNCDYMVLGALLEQVTGKSWKRLVNERIAKPIGSKTLRAYPTRQWVRWGKVDGKREPEIDLAAFGAAAGLYGTAADVIAFDVALMNGRLLPPTALATLWQGDPALGFMALGQWVFDAKLAGCPAPVKLVERRGAIGGVGVRNFIAPDRRTALVILTDEAEFDFGEVWQGKGASHDMLSVVLCTGEAP